MDRRVYYKDFDTPEEFLAEIDKFEKITEVHATLDAGETWRGKHPSDMTLKELVQASIELEAERTTIGMSVEDGTPLFKVTVEIDLEEVQRRKLRSGREG